MSLYLPIAEVSVNAFLLLGLGGLVGVMSGLFGVGGGFLITPLLLLVGIPPPVAVATSANQIVASSFSSLLIHLRRRAVDVPMGLVLLAGGIAGSTLGVGVFNLLAALGQVDLAVKLSYVALLGTIGGMMLTEATRALRHAKAGVTPTRRRHNWVHALPWKMRFRVSGLYISVIPPFAVGLFVGIMSAVMGVGGGFILVPAMIYLLGIPTKVVIGTSTFQVVCTAAWTTFLHAWTSNTVDIVLALLLIVGGVIGAQWGARYSQRLRPEVLRLMLGMLVLAVAVQVAVGLAVEPSEPFTVETRR